MIYRAYTQLLFKKERADSEVAEIVKLAYRSDICKNIDKVTVIKDKRMYEGLYVYMVNFDIETADNIGFFEVTKALCEAQSEFQIFSDEKFCMKTFPYIEEK